MMTTFNLKHGQLIFSKDFLNLRALDFPTLVFSWSNGHIKHFIRYMQIGIVFVTDHCQMFRTILKDVVRHFMIFITFSTLSCNHRFNISTKILTPGMRGLKATGKYVSLSLKKVVQRFLSFSSTLHSINLSLLSMLPQSGITIVGRGINDGTLKSFEAFRFLPRGSGGGLIGKLSSGIHVVFFRSSLESQTVYTVPKRPKERPSSYLRYLLDLSLGASKILKILPQYTNHSKQLSPHFYDIKNPTINYY